MACRGDEWCSMTFNVQIDARKVARGQEWDGVLEGQISASMTYFGGKVI